MLRESVARGASTRRHFGKTDEISVHELQPGMLPSKINAGVLLTDRITQPFAVFVIIFAADPRASLRKPPSTHRVFQGATLTINRPHSVVENGETVEATTAPAASVSRAPRSSRTLHSLEPYRQRRRWSGESACAVQVSSLNTRRNPDGLGKVAVREKRRIQAHRSRTFFLGSASIVNHAHTCSLCSIF